MEKCTDKNKTELLDFLKEAPEENCFFLGDLEQHSLSEECLDIWVNRREGTITSALLRYYSYYSLYMPSPEDAPHVVAQLETLDDKTSLAGLEKAISTVADGLGREKLTVQYLAALRPEHYNPLPPKHRVVRPCEEDAEAILDFHIGIEEFSVTEADRGPALRDIKINLPSTYLCYRNGKIVSSATLVAENSQNGMVIGVATSREERGQGYARAALTELCNDLTARGKAAILFYGNPDAGKLYRSLGFREIGRWARLSF